MSAPTSKGWVTIPGPASLSRLDHVDLLILYLTKEAARTECLAQQHTYVAEVFTFPATWRADGVVTLRTELRHLEQVGQAVPA